jgi:type I site-specific restriction endonuclease
LPADRAILFVAVLSGGNSGGKSRPFAGGIGGGHGFRRIACSPAEDQMTGQDRDQSERLTRKRLIDPELESCGWAVIPFDSMPSAHKRGCDAIAEYPTDNGPADYALAVNGMVLGIVEAKKLTLGPQGVLSQAERYARGLPAGPFDFRGLRAPFLYSTNGEIIWFHDVRNPFSRSRVGI